MSEACETVVIDRPLELEQELQRYAEDGCDE